MFSVISKWEKLVLQQEKFRTVHISSKQYQFSASGEDKLFISFFFFFLIFIWLYQVFSCGMQTLSWRPVGSSSLTRDGTWPLHWEHRVLATGVSVRS